VAYEWITDSLEDTWTQIERLVRPLGPEEYNALTPCPGWTVKDILSHLLGFELLLSGGEVPAFEGEMPAHVKNQIGELNEAFVQSNRELAGSEVLEKFSTVTKASLKRLRALDEESWEKLDGALKARSLTSGFKKLASSTRGFTCKTSAMHFYSPLMITAPARKLW